MNASFKPWVSLLLAISISAATSLANAQAVWHCSRTAPVVGQGTSPEDSFQLAFSGSSVDAISISVIDLLDVYSNKPLSLNGRPVTACFMPVDFKTSADALSSLGLKASSMQLQARKSAIVKSSLQVVTDEQEMLACISKNYPAVGYLSRSVENERVVPCF